MILDNSLWPYVVLIVVFFAFFVWNNRRLKNQRDRRHQKNFRERYRDRRKDED